MQKLLAIAFVFALLLGCASQAPSTGSPNGTIGPVQEQPAPVPPKETEEPQAPPPQEVNSSSEIAANLSVVTQDVVYFEGTKGYLARPEKEGSYPGVVMVHEWWGLNGEIKAMARELSSHGYVVLAVDLYDGKVAADSGEARNLTSSLNQTRAIENMRAAAAYLREEQGAGKVASLGWCFGGGQSLKLALSGEQLDATVIYYGSLVTDEQNLSRISWPVLGVFGEEDQSIPVSRVREFESSLGQVGVENEVYVYPEVGHAFANPTGTNYAPEETADAWEKTLSFLDRNLVK